MGSCDAHWFCAEAYEGWWQETEEGSLVKDCDCLWLGVVPLSWDEWEEVLVLLVRVYSYSYSYSCPYSYSYSY